MGIVSFATSIATKARGIVGLVPALYKFKVLGKRMGVVGIALNVVWAGVTAVQKGNPSIFVNQVGYSFFALDQGISRHVEQLTSASGTLPFWEFVLISLGIYSKLWFILFITGKVTSFREKSAVGDNAPDYTLFLETLVFVITPLHFAGAFVFSLFKTGQVTSIPSVWGGVIELVFSLDVWAAQFKGNLVKLPFVSPELFSQAGNGSGSFVGEGLSNLTGNSSGNVSGTGSDGVTVIGGAE